LLRTAEQPVIKKRYPYASFPPFACILLSGHGHAEQSKNSTQARKMVAYLS